MSAKLIQTALDKGEVIAYPTEAVWGLGCDYRNQAAVNKLLQLKNRATAQGFILICSTFTQAKPLLEVLPEHLKAQLTTYWPGFTTLVLPDINHQIPQWIKGEHTTFALRISKHPTIQQINQSWPYPIVSTSANKHGENPAKTSAEVRVNFGKTVRIIEGELGGEQKPSQIIDLATGIRLR